MSGSSPRVWGTPLTVIRPTPSERFIPTCVGNTCPPASQSHTVPVHPHVCGEHMFSRVQLPINIGSSPRVWGTHTAFDAQRQPERFIPTCVGNTVVTTLIQTQTTVHPHVCGEHTEWILKIDWGSGSSPRVWGTLSGPRSRSGPSRFIPTCVGNTLLLPKKTPLSSVHPHVCGEHWRSSHRARASSGSSPRVWGTPIWSPFLRF